MLIRKEHASCETNGDPRIAAEMRVKERRREECGKVPNCLLNFGICLDASPLRFAHNVSDTQFTSIFLDNVLDPGNFGAIARSALFFGCEQIVYAEGRG
ncbi:unnamed protein product [Strongylus vulgaris]|uniref:tRNA/rRNA methyltransferase SpoU type domain-containing protein n=1 Tax=Strongylus vulgaris TaxID=40348 RepID=A0A3P7LS57_STRVU|nr:unnamed protein product [Strongylus vulgaris]